VRGMDWYWYLLIALGAVFGLGALAAIFWPDRQSAFVPDGQSLDIAPPGRYLSLLHNSGRLGWCERW